MDRFRSLLFIFLFSSLSAFGQSLLVGSYNIRYSNDEDSIKGNGWDRRCDVVCSQVNFEHPDIFGAQEVLAPQLHDMLSQLDGYSYIGVGRDDGKEAGEYAPIFYDTATIELIRDGHFWLSQTPNIPGKGWDAACTRICTWGEFKHKNTGNRFFFFNLHLDHIGKVAREKSARLVIQKIVAIATIDNPVILTGDFNVDQTDSIYNIFSQSGLLRDCYVYSRLRFAENGTFNDYKQDIKTQSRIDHVFVSPHFNIDRYGILTNAYWTRDGKKGKDIRRVPSDHYPVFVHLKF